MPLIVPRGLPAAQTVRQEGTPVFESAAQAPACPLRVLLLNLMPQKPVTELDFVRALAPIGSTWLELIPMKISGQRYKTTPQEYVERFYTDFEQLAERPADGLIVTGAPIEHLPFEDVRYWPQLQQIFNWAERHVRATLFICWGAQAGLYHHYGVPKHALPQKMFGVFPQRVVRTAPLLQGLGNPFAMPHSRHTEVRLTDVERTPGLSVLATSAESGPSIIEARGGRQLFITGHIEYAADTLHREYCRDLSRHLPIQPPQHYYAEPGNPRSAIRFSWQQAGLHLYRNWVEHYVSPAPPAGPETCSPNPTPHKP